MDNPQEHPPHYNKGKIEHWDVVEDWGLDYLLGNCTKYIARHMHKGTKIADIEKAIVYLEKYLEILRAEEYEHGQDYCCSPPTQ